LGLRLTFVAIALLLAVGCKEGNDAKKPATAQTPRVLADGGGPAPLQSDLRRIHGQPVIGARELSARVAVRSCPIDPHLRAKAHFSQAWVSTEGLTVELALSSVLLACDAVKDGDRWVPCGIRDSRSLDPRRVELTGGGLNVLCQKPTRIEAMWVAVPRSATWTLVDHGNFWVAYRSARRPLIRVTNKGSSGSFRVAFLDQHSRLLRERRIMGYVAG
jgi:hypothetical protein